MRLTAVIRIRGKIGLEEKKFETLKRLNLNKKYSCKIFQNISEVEQGMLNKVRDLVAFGDIDNETFIEVVKKRGYFIDKTKKTDLENSAKEIIKGKSYSDANIKNIFRLSPPRGGIKSKLHYPKGVLGDNKDNIKKLLLRML